MAATKRKRVSKKNKKSWRKNVSIDDVEDFLDEKRLEERTGCKVTELKNEELFEIHVVGDNEEKRRTKKKSHASKKDNSPKSFRIKEQTVPNCFAILEKRSKVNDPIVKRNRVRTCEERMHPALRKRLQQRLEKGILTDREKQSISDSMFADVLRKSRVKVPQFEYDIWGKPDSKKIDNYAEWLSNDTVRHTLTNTGGMRKIVPESVKKKTSFLPAVEAPHPGMSYNPSLRDHTDIINKVVEEEMKLVNEEKHLKRVTTDLYCKVSEAVSQKEWLKEMSSGLVVEPKSEDETECVGGDYTTVNPPVKNKKKTLQKRRRLREAAKLKAELKQKKIEKKKLSDLYRLRKMNSEIKKHESLLKLLREKKKEKKKAKSFQTKQLSSNKYEEPQTDFTPIEELTGNLRGVKPTANLLRDRFMSLQKRNILEPTVRQYPKKAKMKKYERQHTKMGWEPKGY